MMMRFDPLVSSESVSYGSVETGNTTFGQEGEEGKRRKRMRRKRRRMSEKESGRVLTSTRKEDPLLVHLVPVDRFVNQIPRVTRTIKMINTNEKREPTKGNSDSLMEGFEGGGKKEGRRGEYPAAARTFSKGSVQLMARMRPSRSISFTQNS